MHLCPGHISELVCVSIDRHDWYQSTGPAPLPRTRAGGPTLPPTALHPDICGSSTETTTAPPLWGLPQVYRGAQRRVVYCQQMGPDVVRWGHAINPDVVFEETVVRKNFQRRYKESDSKWNPSDTGQWDDKSWQYPGVESVERMFHQNQGDIWR